MSIGAKPTLHSMKPDSSPSSQSRANLKQKGMLSNQPGNLTHSSNAQASRQPIAPAVYRPKPAREIVQPKTTVAQRPQPHEMRAPAVYRPQPTPKCLQLKERNTGQAAAAHRVGMQGASAPNKPGSAAKILQQQNSLRPAQALPRTAKPFGLASNQTTSSAASRGVKPSSSIQRHVVDKTHHQCARHSRSVPAPRNAAQSGTIQRIEPLTVGLALTGAAVASYAYNEYRLRMGHRRGEDTIAENVTGTIRSYGAQHEAAEGLRQTDIAARLAQHFNRPRDLEDPSSLKLMRAITNGEGYSQGTAVLVNSWRGWYMFEQQPNPHVQALCQRLGISYHSFGRGFERHAEVHAVSYLNNYRGGLQRARFTVSKPICPDCANMLRQVGATFHPNSQFGEVRDPHWQGPDDVQITPLADPQFRVKRDLLGEENQATLENMGIGQLQSTDVGGRSLRHRPAH